MRTSFASQILKTRASRFARVRQESGAKPSDLVVVTEFLKPGIDELCALLPPRLSRFVMRQAEQRGMRHRLNVGIHLKTSTLSGFLLLWLMGRMGFWRVWSRRYRDEQENLDGWLATVKAAAAIDRPFALEVVSTARLIKGYGSTFERGIANYRLIHSLIVAPALANGRPPNNSVAAAVSAALADPDGVALVKTLPAPLANTIASQLRH